MPTFLVLLLFLLLMAVLIAGYFYLSWAKARGAAQRTDPDNVQEGH